jgi:adenylate cyclase
MVQEPPVRVERRLSAILAADVAGYSRLMHSDEEPTHAKLAALLIDVVNPAIAEHGGRIVKNTGDGFLAEFPSAVEAVRAAMLFQTRTHELTIGDAEDRRLRFRVGINIGDVIVEPHDIFGDGVNIAARLESIAEPGGICISSSAYDQVLGKITVEFVDLGEQRLKNIARPVRAYALVQHRGGAKSNDSMPGRPSVGVLPFKNLSGDPRQEYFSDGITEDIITELSRFSELVVIARNSTFQYKGKSVDVRQVGQELGVRYLLEGSIRREDNRVRITAQLIDAKTGAQRWAERYDREIKDVFAVQDEVAGAIAVILAAHVNKAEAERTLLKPAAAWEAYDYYMRAAEAFSLRGRGLSTESIYGARRLLEMSLLGDPNYARAYAMLSSTYWWTYVEPVDDDYLNPSGLERANHLATTAVQLDPNLPQAHAQLGWVLLFKREHEAGIAEFEQAFALNHNFVDSRFALGLIYAGEPARAIETLQANTCLDPFSPFREFWFSGPCLLHCETLQGGRADAASIPIAAAEYTNPPALVGCYIRPTGAACESEVRGGGCPAD